MSNRLYNQFSYSPERQPINLMGKFTQTAVEVAASLVNQAVTYTAKDAGVAGNAISIRLIVPGSNGALSIAVVGNAISVTLAKTLGVVVTDATALVAAINGDVSASALVTASGTGSSPLIALAATNLAGGAEAIFASNAMNMSITQTATGTYTVQLQDEFPEVLSAQVMLMSSAVQNLVPQIVSANTAFGSSKTVVIRTITMDTHVVTNMVDTSALFVHLILRNSSN